MVLYEMMVFFSGFLSPESNDIKRKSDEHCGRRRSRSLCAQQFKNDYSV